jgi:hypothetical protein
MAPSELQKTTYQAHSEREALRGSKHIVPGNVFLSDANVFHTFASINASTRGDIWAAIRLKKIMPAGGSLIQTVMQAYTTITTQLTE